MAIFRIEFEREYTITEGCTRYVEADTVTDAMAKGVEHLNNIYECAECNTSWSDEWCCACDDECPPVRLRHIASGQRNAVGLLPRGQRVLPSVRTRARILRRDNSERRYSSADVDGLV